MRTIACTILATAVLAGCSSPGVESPDSAQSQHTVTDQRAVVATDQLTDGVVDPKDDYLEVAFGDSEFLMRPRIGSIEPWLAEAITQTTPTTWQIQLRPDVTFQNGKPVDAKAIVSWLQYELSGGEAQRASLGDPTSIVAAGDRVVEVTTSTPFASLANTLAGYDWPVYDAETVQQVNGNFNELVGKGIFTGPFALTALRPGERTYQRNERYWGGAVALTGLTVKAITDPQAAVNAVAAGEVNIVFDPPVNTVVAARGRPGVHFTIAKEAPEYFGINLNPYVAPLDDVRVRRAFALAIDNNAIAKGATFGVGTPLKGAFPSDSPLAYDWKSFDLPQARTLLDQAGWVPGPDGVRVKGGNRLSVPMYIYNDNFEAVATIAAPTLKEVGFDPKLIRLESADAAPEPLRRDGGAYLLNLQGFGQTGDPRLTLAQNFRVGDIYNNVPVRDERIEQTFARIADSTDPAEIAAGLREVQKYNAEDVFYIPLVMQGYRLLTDDAYQHMPVSPMYLFIDRTTAPAG